MNDAHFFLYTLWSFPPYFIFIYFLKLFPPPYFIKWKHNSIWDNNYFRGTHQILGAVLVAWHEFRTDEVFGKSRLRRQDGIFPALPCCTICRLDTMHGICSSHVWMWELDHKGGRAPKNWCLQTVVLEKNLESPLDSRQIKPVNPNGNQPWTLIGRTDAEPPPLWPPDVKSWLLWKDPGAGKGWRQTEKGASEDEMVR